MELLQVTTREHARWTVVTAVGQLDVATAPRFRQVLQEAQYGGGTHVVVDLEGVEFLDSFGLGVLVGALRRARSHRTGFAVAVQRPRLLHLLELTGLDQVLRVVADVDEVLDAV